MTSVMKSLKENKLSLDCLKHIVLIAANAKLDKHCVPVFQESIYGSPYHQAAGTGNYYLNEKTGEVTWHDTDDEYKLILKEKEFQQKVEKLLNGNDD